MDAITKTISTVAGTGTAGYNGDDISATTAHLNYPIRVALDGSNNLYIADYLNQRIRKVTVSSGKISTVAGTGTAGFAGDGGVATAAQLNNPAGVAVDAGGSIYIADMANTRIRKVEAGSGNISTVAGGGSKLGDEGPGIDAMFVSPYGIAIGTGSTLYIADQSSSRVRYLDSGGFIHTVAGSGSAGFGGDGGPAVGVRIRATAGGYTDGIIAAQVMPTQFVFTDLATNLTTLNLIDNFRVRPYTNGSEQRLAADTTVTLGSTDPTVLSPPATVALLSNLPVSV